MHTALRHSPRSEFCRSIVTVAATGVATICLSALPLRAQQPGGGGGQGGNQGGQNQQAGGILIDSEGVVRPQPDLRQSAKLQQERRDAFSSRAYSGDLREFSPQRNVSLVALESECARLLEQNQQPGEDILYLAGLQRIDYLFVDEQSRDLVLSGPAEGFAPDPQGRMRGLTSGRPPLQVEDLVVALNAVFKGSSSIGCSIDPEPDRLARLGEFVRSNSNATSPAIAAARYRRMCEILGLQNVSIFGVPEDSHFAHVLVEADFRMKRIALGVEPSGIRGLSSHLSLLRPGGNSIQRWWFVPYYEAISGSEDGHAFHLSGQRVQLLSQEEVSSLSGDRSDAAFTRATTEQFARMFTERFPDLAEKSPVFAQLQNLFDLTIVAALLQKEDLPGRVGWSMNTFRERQDELIGSYAVARRVPSDSTFRRASKGMILGLVGGVTIRPRQLLQTIDMRSEDAVKLGGLRQGAFSAEAPPEHSWWWD